MNTTRNINEWLSKNEGDWFSWEHNGYEAEISIAFIGGFYLLEMGNYYGGLSFKSKSLLLVLTIMGAWCQDNHQFHLSGDSIAPEELEDFGIFLDIEG